LLDDQRLGRKEPNVMLVGADYDPRFQQTAFFVEETGEYGEPQLNHNGEKQNDLSKLSNSALAEYPRSAIPQSAPFTEDRSPCLLSKVMGTAVNWEYISNNPKGH
jgi:hypothetical protein